MTETHSSMPHGAESDQWRELRALNDLDLGALAHKTGNEVFSMLRALPVTGEDRISACHREVGGWVESCSKVAEHGARIRRALPPPPNPELDALSVYLGQPRGRLLEGAQRLVDHNNELRVSRDAWAREAQDTANTLAAVEPAEDALLAIGRALDVVGTGKPWAEIGRAGVAAVALLNTHLKTARQGWADESAAACRARVERDKSRAEVATLSEQVASLRADVAETQRERRTRGETIQVQEATIARLRQQQNALRQQQNALETERTEWHRWAKCIVGPRDGAGEGLRNAVSARLASVHDEFTTLRDAARTLLPADSTPNPATGWLADVIRGSGAIVTGLRAQVERSAAKTHASEAEVESRAAALRSLREQRDGLRANLAQAQDTVAGWMAKHDKVAAEVADLRERRADCVVAAEDLAAHRLEAVAAPVRPRSMACTPAGIHLGFGTTTGGLAIRLTRDEALALRGWLINASGLPATEPRERSLRAVSAAVPQVVVNIGAGRTVTAPEPLKTSGLLTYSAEGNGPPAPAANLEPLRRAACALIDAAAALTHPKAA